MANCIREKTPFRIIYLVHVPSTVLLGDSANIFFVLLCARKFLYRPLSSQDQKRKKEVKDDVVRHVVR